MSFVVLLVTLFHKSSGIWTCTFQISIVNYSSTSGITFNAINFQGNGIFRAFLRVSPRTPGLSSYKCIFFMGRFNITNISPILRYINNKRVQLYMPKGPFHFSSPSSLINCPFQHNITSSPSTEFPALEFCEQLLQPAHSDRVAQICAKCKAIALNPLPVFCIEKWQYLSDPY